jgi:hypothetical protein
LYCFWIRDLAKTGKDDRKTKYTLAPLTIPVLEFRLDGGRWFGCEEDLLGQLVEAACCRPLLTWRGKQERADKSRPKSARANLNIFLFYKRFSS